MINSAERSLTRCQSGGGGWGFFFVFLLMNAETPETFLSLRGDDVYSGKARALTAASAPGVQIKECPPPPQRYRTRVNRSAFVGILHQSANVSDMASLRSTQVTGSTTACGTRSAWTPGTYRFLWPWTASRPPPSSCGNNPKQREFFISEVGWIRSWSKNMDFFFFLTDTVDKFAQS